MKPTLVIVGRPNVGKSTLFNRLTRTRDALVAAVPGLTRDRHYGLGRLGERPYLVVDTGGLEPEARGVFVAVNKAEGMNPSLATLEFHEMGLGVPYAISAEHGDGVHDLVEAALADYPVEKESGEPDGAVRIAIVGRPNAGKSTLVNALVGEERVVTFEEPGTTRDAIDVELAVQGRRYVLVDTAGLRRRGKVFESVEKFSVVKTLQAIDRANVAVLVLDAQGQISDQDAHIAGFILERALARRLKFLSFARFHYISAREGRGVAQLIESVDRAYRAAMAKLPTPKLTRALIAAVAKQAPPRAGLSRPKLRYAHQGGSNPPTVVVHGTALNAVPDSYRRYLEADFRKVFRLEGTPLRIEFRSGRNPYVGKRL